MNRFFFAILLITFSSCKSSNISSTDYSLYNHVDSLITKVLNYEYNENSFIKPTDLDTAQKRSLQSPQTTMPFNPEPIIMLSGSIAKKEDLKGYSLKKMKTIEVIMPGPKTAALFGTQGKNGVIYIDKKKLDLEMMK